MFFFFLGFFGDHQVKLGHVCWGLPFQSLRLTFPCERLEAQQFLPDGQLPIGANTAAPVVLKGTGKGSG